MKKIEFVVLRKGIEDYTCETMPEAMAFVQAVLTAYPKYDVADFEVKVIFSNEDAN